MDRGDRPIDVSRAQRAPRRPLRHRWLVVEGKPMLAFDAHALLEADSAAELSRPGHRE